MKLVLVLVGFAAGWLSALAVTRYFIWWREPVPVAKFTVEPLDDVVITGSGPNGTYTVRGRLVHEDPA